MSVEHTDQANDMQPPLDIAVGVVRDGDGHVLAARRTPTQSSAGYWEFPGGKVEAGESVEAALARELAEEVGIEIRAPRRLIRFTHALGVAPVRLHVFTVDDWNGPAEAKERQLIRFVEPATMRDPGALPATGVIINALTLANRYLITPEFGDAPYDDWLTRLEGALAAGIKLVRLRQPELADSDYEALAAEVVARVARAGGGVMLDRDAAMVLRVGAAGLHWPASCLAEDRPPIGDGRLFAVSAHSSEDLAHATAAGADFATLSPVFATSTHPNMAGIGWSAWRRTRADHALPVYALGGLGEADLDAALASNAQGIAAIRAFASHPVGG
ncbi:Nudix family hydrolase [Salinisphaera sp. USBA-960]|nr:Nudix family hydrolase [Salifodinibacter halophilus]NNC26553.1 Nudix family hydrolase [Salifodinibacter halophilus]